MADFLGVDVHASVSVWALSPLFQAHNFGLGDADFWTWCVSSWTSLRGHVPSHLGPQQIVTDTH